MTDKTKNLTGAIDQWLTVDEAEVVVLAAVRGSGELADEQLRRALKWARRTRIDADLLDLVLAGDVNILVPENPKLELRFDPLRTYAPRSTDGEEAEFGIPPSQRAMRAAIVAAEETMLRVVQHGVRMSEAELVALLDCDPFAVEHVIKHLVYWGLFHLGVDQTGADVVRWLTRLPAADRPELNQFIPARDGANYGVPLLDDDDDRASGAGENLTNGIKFKVQT